LEKRFQTELAEGFGAFDQRHGIERKQRDTEVAVRARCEKISTDGCG
jgi:hypothetical protein